jgi:hypothetical protein
MMNHRSLRHSIMQASGAHRAPAAGIVRRLAMGGILVLGLTLGGLGAAVLALPGHVSGSPGQASAHQRVNSHAHHVALNKTKPKAWMY